ncbi:MAG: hypothetical protein KIT08_10505 [Anaerolineales bacterium]|nr:MAG: hypothetical protein KIT08_10505 [Anaerolineales bacterium]
MSTRSLSDLVLDEAKLVEELLAATLRPLVRISRSGELILEPAFRSLSLAQKVLTVIAAAKAMKLLEIRDSEEIGPTEIALLAGIPVGSVKPSVRALLNNGDVEATPGGRYTIPLRNLNLLSSMLQGGQR